MKLTRAFLLELADSARRDYDKWRHDNPDSDPVVAAFPDAIWNLEAVANQLLRLPAFEKAKS